MTGCNSGYKRAAVVFIEDLRSYPEVSNGSKRNKNLWSPQILGRWESYDVFLPRKT